MLMDLKGDAFIKSTPKGRNGFWQMYQYGIDPNNSEWTSFHYPTAANPYIPPSEIEAMKKSLPEIIYRQEVLAEFIDDQGGVFRRVQEAATMQQLEKPLEGHQYIAGVDVASSIDFTVVSVLDVADKAQVYMDRFNRVDYNVLENRLEAVYKHWHLDTMKIEANSIGQPVIDHLDTRGICQLSRSLPRQPRSRPSSRICRLRWRMER